MTRNVARQNEVVANTQCFEIVQNFGLAHSTWSTGSSSFIKYMWASNWSKLCSMGSNNFDSVQLCWINSEQCCWNHQHLSRRLCNERATMTLSSQSSVTDVVDKYVLKRMLRCTTISQRGDRTMYDHAWRRVHADWIICSSARHNRLRDRHTGFIYVWQDSSWSFTIKNCTVTHAELSSNSLQTHSSKLK